MIIFIKPSGEARFLYQDCLASLALEGNSRTARASHVEPHKDGWTADMAPVGGPVLGPFSLRQEALDAEKKWLEEHGIPEPGKGT